MNGLQYRKLMSRVPTSVVVATSTHEGQPIGMVIGTFTSVSLEPAMVGFLGDLDSKSLPLLKESGRISFSVLSDDSFPEVINAFRLPLEQRFKDIAWSESPNGLPRIDAAVLYVEGPIIGVMEAGDHEIIRVAPESIELGTRTSPLVFWGGQMMGVGDVSLPDPIWHLGRVGESSA